jgi:hypothetical protein
VRSPPITEVEDKIASECETEGRVRRSVGLAMEFTDGELRLVGPPLPSRTARAEEGEGREQVRLTRFGPWPRCGPTQASRKKRGGEKQSGPPVRPWAVAWSWANLC